MKLKGKRKSSNEDEQNRAKDGKNNKHKKKIHEKK